MPILTLISGLVKLANFLVGWLDRRGLMDAGKAQQVRTNVIALADRLELVGRIKADNPPDFDSDIDEL